MPSLFLYHLSLQKIICTKPHSIYQECYEKYFMKSYDIILDCEKFFKPGSISYDCMALQYFSWYQIPKNPSEVRYHGYHGWNQQNRVKTVAG